MKTVSMNKLKFGITLSIGIAVNFGSFGQFSLSSLINADAMGISGDSLKKMDGFFHDLVDEAQLAGIQTAVLHNGKLIHFDSYGYADIETQKALDEKSIFRIFSMTKPIVSVALMQLYEQGKFKLEDPLHKYIPEFKESYVLEDTTLVVAQNPIKIIDLLKHTSGYSYGNGQNSYLNAHYARMNLYASRTNKEFVTKLSKIPLQFEPGTNWQYGMSTNICGHLIEVLSGRSLDEYLTDFIFDPLQMKDTHFQLPEEKVNRFTTGYGWNDQSGLYVAENSEDNRYTNEVTLFNGGGGLVSTTFDYLRFCQMILNGGSLYDVRIIKDQTIDLMLTDHLETTRQHQTERLRLPSGEAGFGFGFAIRGEHPDALQKVFGWGGALGTYFKIDAKHDLVYVMMIQLSPYRHLDLRRKIQEFVESAIR